MRDSIQQHFSITLHISGFIVAICVAVFIVHSSQSTMHETITESLSQYESTILNLAEITDRNGADAETAKIISDCPRREDYEAHLVRLSALSKQELVVMQNLFEGCSPFYVEQKQLMVYKLEQAVTTYTEYLVLLDLIDDVNAYEEKLRDFTSIVDLEKERSMLLVDQTRIQERIITLLISGKSAQSIEVSAQVQDAGQIAELLSVLDHRIDEIRSKYIE